MRDLEAFYQKLVKELNLDEAQQKAVRQATNTYAQALKNWQAEHGEEFKALMKEIREVGREDREKLRPLREKQRKLFQDRGQLGQAYYKQIMDVLNEDQKVKFRRIIREINRPDPITLLRSALRRLGLSEEVSKKANGILTAAQADAKKVDDPKAKAEIMKKAVAAVKALLTEQQKARLERMMQAQARQRGAHAGVPGILGRLNLSADQTRQVKEIMSGVQGDPAKRREAWRKVINDVLTPEQHEQLQKLRAARQGQGARPRRARRREAGQAQE